MLIRSGLHQFRKGPKALHPHAVFCSLRSASCVSPGHSLCSQSVGSRRPFSSRIRRSRYLRLCGSVPGDTRNKASASISLLTVRRNGPQAFPWNRGMMGETTIGKPQVRLALAAPVFAAPGIPTMRTPSMSAASWPIVRKLVVRAEELGYDSAWFSDHLFLGKDGEFFESWSALAMAAGFTERIRLVNNHLGNGLRDARIVAKMATTVAAATNGRFDLFLARGYREREYRSYGLAWESDEVRTTRLAEAVSVVRALWTGASVSFDGQYYQVTEATSAPTHGDRPFVWLGGPLDDQTVALIAREADGWNSFPASPHEYAAAAARIDKECRRIGRRPETLRRSLETQVLILENWSEWYDWLNIWRRLREDLSTAEAARDTQPEPDELSDEAVTEACRENFIVGTRAEVANRIAMYQKVGVTDLVCWFMDAPSDNSLSQLREIVDNPT